MPLASAATAVATGLESVGRQARQLGNDLGYALSQRYVGTPITQETLSNIAGDIQQWYIINQNFDYDTTGNASTVTQTFRIPNNVYIDSDATSGTIRVTQRYDDATTANNFYTAHQFVVPTVQTSGTLTIRSNIGNGVRYQDVTGNWYDTPMPYGWSQNWKERPESKVEAFRKKLRQQLSPMLMIKRNIPDFSVVKESEIVALRLLRKMVDEYSFKRYLKYGFVAVEAPSGLIYQIPRNGGHIQVRKRDKVVASLCIHLKNEQSMPPTDQVIAKILMAECDELGLWKRSNVTHNHQYIRGDQVNVQFLERMAS